MFTQMIVVACALAFLADQPANKTLPINLVPRVQPNSLEIDAVLAEPPRPKGATSAGTPTLRFAEGVVAGLSRFVPAGARSRTEKARCTLWIHKGGQTSVVLPSVAEGTVLLHGVTADGMIWGIKDGKPLLWKDGNVIQIPETPGPGRTSPDSTMSITVLPSGRVGGTAAPNHHFARAAFTYDLRAKSPDFEWLGIRDAEYVAPEGGAIFSTLLGERPDGSLIGSSYRFRPGLSDKGRPEFGGSWIGETAWVMKDGLVKPFVLASRKPAENAFSAPLRILKSGEVMVAIPEGIGRVSADTISPIRIPGYKPDWRINVLEATDDGRFLVLGATEPGGKTEHWHLSGNTVTAIRLPSESTMPTKGFRHNVYKLLDSGAVIFVLSGLQGDNNIGGWSPWIWNNGRISVPSLGNAREDRAVWVAGTLVSRSQRYIGGDYLVRPARDGDSRELRRAWLYDLQTQREIPIAEPIFKDKEEETSKLLSIGSNGTVLLRRHGDSFSRRPYVWTPATGLQPLLVRTTGGQADPLAFVETVHGFVGGQETHLAVTVDGFGGAASGGLVHVISK